MSNTNINNLIQKFSSTRSHYLLDARQCHRECYSCRARRGHAQTYIDNGVQVGALVAVVSVHRLSLACHCTVYHLTPSSTATVTICSSDQLVNNTMLSPLSNDKNGNLWRGKTTQNQIGTHQRSAALSLDYTFLTRVESGQKMYL